MAEKKLYAVKRRGHVEPFDDRKLYASVYAACRSSHMNAPECEGMADKVLKEVKKGFPKNAKSIQSTEIFNLAIQALKKHSKDAAFLYETHRDLS